jgi:two-component system response regulator AtoC
LLQHDWPGNVRELQNVIQRAMVVANREEIQLADLPERLRSRAGAETAKAAAANREANAS